MRLVNTVLAAAALSLALAAPASAKPPLSQVSEIDDGLMAVAIADEIRKRCDDIRARMIKALSVVNALESRAKDMGYSDDEIEDYVTSKSEKKRMRKKATAYLASQGVTASDTAQLCSFGKKQMAKATSIGILLR
ncbi:DUF5333 domain-containing protein [Thalassococcus lentus]|uniref:DUF5333 domain-containing protein n=1 Tax=Thalassococcus lentus TaxID=1210524 RepID=A0ABT4XXB4_9RHOB|nr:DUF5333 domain-containing protein [Thalassococcus lentus]MDA7426610.1 DUF5333 domain-containing protein [Thalassococcus lentus]